MGCVDQWQENTMRKRDAKCTPDYYLLKWKTKLVLCIISNITNLKDLLDPFHTLLWSHRTPLLYGNGVFYISLCSLLLQTKDVRLAVWFCVDGGDQDGQGICALFLDNDVNIAYQGNVCYLLNTMAR